MEFKTTIVEIQANQVSLQTESNQIISWPKALLPLEIEVGQVFYLQINPQPQATAKNILNEILDLD